MIIGMPIAVYIALASEAAFCLSVPISLEVEDPSEIGL